MLLVACGGSSGDSGSSTTGGSGGGDSSSVRSRAAQVVERSAAITAAKGVYAVSKKAGSNLSKGPCLAEKLPGLPDWVVDIAHNPRQKVDNEPANQCARYESGAAHHFVELDPNGKLIRTH